MEIVVHDDGSDPETVQVLIRMLSGGEISKLILSPTGHNEGVGAAFNRAAAVSTGDPVCKIDQDLTFQPGWLRKVVEWLDQDPDVGMFGLFRYHIDPVDWRQMNHRDPPDESPGFGQYEYCDDFVGSAMCVPREVLDELGPFPEHSTAFAEDVSYKKLLQSKGLELALPCQGDLAVNHGFGVGPSTVVRGWDQETNTGIVQEIHDGPLILG